MAPRIYVKVVGFTDVERHALNTLFRLSIGQPISYGLWTPETTVEPDVALIDLDSYASAVELALPVNERKFKIICVGRGTHAYALRTLQRPLIWSDVVNTMDSLFPATEKLDAGIDFGDTDMRAGLPPEFKATLLIDPLREDRMYLRARLALAGRTTVDEAATGAQALELAKIHNYDLVLVSLDMPSPDGWALVTQLLKLEPAIERVIVTTQHKTLDMHEYADACGCSGLLEKPFDPLKVASLLSKI